MLARTSRLGACPRARAGGNVNEHPPGQSASSAPAALPRRKLLDLFLGGGLAAWAATVVYPLLRYLSPLPEASAADEVTLGDGARRQIETEGFAIVALGAARVLVFRDPQGALRATSAKCTHEGCTVRYKADESIIWCACHNGRFHLDGRVLSGPPPRPLARYRASGSLDTQVVVRPGEESPA
jgi:cytochrome b6-f complex iron-sulfur subunit